MDTRTMTRHLTISSFFVSLAIGSAACGGGYSGYVLPSEHAVNPWVAPLEDDLVADEGAESGSDEAFEDYVDYEDEEGEAEESPAPATQTP